MTAQALETPRFLRRTRLGPNEYRKNFYQIDCDTVAALTSKEADGVTPLMSKIYLNLVHAPGRFWEREGVLRFECEVREGRGVKAWTVLCGVLGVASATASKALHWMRDQGIIGYFAGKNGVGIRIFLNRASSSIGTRPHPAGQKILAFSRGSSPGRAVSTAEPAFNDSFAVLESLDPDVIPRAPEGGADETPTGETSPAAQALPPAPREARRTTAGVVPERERGAPKVFVSEVVRRVVAELEPSLRDAAARAAAREHERTREWLEQRGLPKAARVAQREAFNVIRRYVSPAAARRGVAVEAADAERARAPETPKPLTRDELTELAETCVAMLEVHGRAIEATLAELGGGAGGSLLPGDASEVRRLAEAMCGAGVTPGAGRGS